MTQQTDQQAGRIEVKNLFPTPVATFLIPDADRINTALAQRIFEREKTVPSVAHSNLGGWQSPDDFRSWCGPEGQVVLDVATRMA